MMSEEIYCRKCGNRKMYATCQVCYPPPKPRENVCSTMLDADFLQWIHDRLEFVYKEDRYYDYMWRLREVAESLRPVTSSAG